MKGFSEMPVVTDIEMAAFFSKESGTPIQKIRTSHGLVWYVDCYATYRFSTGEVLTCHSGECIYLPKDSRYTASRYKERESEERGIYAINFQTCADSFGGKPFVMRIRGRDEMEALFARSANAWRTKEVGFYEECMSNLYRILKLLHKEAQEYSPMAQSLRVIAPAVDYINQTYTEQTISLSHLASLCGISEPYLRRLFHNVFGESPSVYMRNMRIRYAKELLASGETSVTDVASWSGFNDVAYFSREFKKAVGVSPKDYLARGEKTASDTAVTQKEKST